jgi:NAD(P)-dependent dehydrogenase (short-subunit alcohol dehydrogenase family)
MDLGLKGKTVIVTGGSGGIGRGLLLEFAREGCNVVNASRDMTIGAQIEADAKSQGLAGPIVSIKTDITDRKSVDALVAATHERFGLVDVLVNNAGGVAAQSPFELLSEETRKWELALNVDGVINCTQAVADDMLSRGKGSVVNIGSNSSLLGEAAQQVVHYGATKGFVNSFSKALAYEWGPKGVRVNNISPGWIVPHADEHVGKQSFWNRFGFQMMGTTAGMQAAMEQGSLFNMANLPIKRLGRPEDIANLALFLASDRSSYITGQLIGVGGGAYMP